MPAAAKTLRSDARRNRERLIASARDLFARDGIDVPVEEITRDAGVGMGTLYRHFPTKDDLVDAVLEDAFAEILALAEQAATADDAWTGFATFLERTLELHAHRSLRDVLASHEHGARHAGEMRRRIRPLLRSVIERAQAQGTLRADFAPQDVALIFWSAGRVIEKSAGVAGDVWRRYLAFLLDGLRATAATPVATPPLTSAQLARAQKRRTV